MQSKTNRISVKLNKRLRKKVMSYVGAAVALVSLGFAPSLQAQSAVPAKSIFRHLKLPFNIGTVEGIAATASDNVWAVNAAKSLHFDGKSWSEQKLVPSEMIC